MKIIQDNIPLVMNIQKIMENRLRRMARKHGYRLAKSRARDPQSLTYGGYALIDVASGGASLGGTGNANRGFSATLEEIEEFLAPEEAE